MAKRAGTKRARRGGWAKGLRIQKRVRVASFMKINFSKSGVSFSLGRRGFWLNIGTGGIRISVGVPGTGISYRRTFSGQKLKTFLEALLGSHAPD